VVRHVGRRRESEFGHEKARSDFGDQLAESVGVLGLSAVKPDSLLAPMAQLVKCRLVKRLGSFELMAERNLDVIAIDRVERLVPAVMDLGTRCFDCGPYLIFASFRRRSGRVMDLRVIDNKPSSTRARRTA
jgi:hypothetical protein